MTTTSEVTPNATAPVPDVAAPAADVAPATVVTPHRISLMTGAIQPGAIAQVPHLMTFAGRLVGLRCGAGGGRITRVITDGATALRKSTDPRSWVEILHAEPMVLITTRSLIVIVTNDTVEARAFEIELEIEADPSLEPVTVPKAAAGSGARAAMRSAPTAPPGSRPVGPTPNALPPTSAAPRAATRPPAIQREADEAIYLVLDRQLCERMTLLLTRGMPLDSSELSRTLAAFQHGRTRKDPPNTRYSDLLVTVRFDLLVRLDAFVRSGVRLGAEDRDDALRAFAPPPRPAGAPSKGRASSEARFHETPIAASSPLSVSELAEIAARGAEVAVDAAPSPAAKAIELLTHVDPVAIEACARTLDALVAELRIEEPDAESFRRGVMYAAVTLRGRSSQHVIADADPARLDPDAQAAEPGATS